MALTELAYGQPQKNKAGDLVGREEGMFLSSAAQKRSGTCPLPRPTPLAACLCCFPSINIRHVRPRPPCLSNEVLDIFLKIIFFSILRQKKHQPGRYGFAYREIRIVPGGACFGGNNGDALALPVFPFGAPRLGKRSNLRCRL